MSEGHLTLEARKLIKSWKRKAKPMKKLSIDNLIKLLDTIEANVRWPDFSINYYLDMDICDKPVVVFEFHTGGWSGHEDLIAELQDTWFWMFCWQESRRGGHYKFYINVEQWK